MKYAFSNVNEVAWTGGQHNESANVIELKYFASFSLRLKRLLLKRISEVGSLVKERDLPLI